MVSARRKPCASPAKVTYARGIIGAHGVDHYLGLVRRHYPIFESLEQDDRTRQAVRVIDRGTLPVRLLAHYSAGQARDAPSPAE